MRLTPIKWLFGPLLVCLALIGALALGTSVWIERAGLEAVRAGLSSAEPWLRGWRLALFAILIVYWHELARWTARRFALGAAAEISLRQWRWRAGAGLLVMDLILVEGGLGIVRNILR